MNSIVLNEILMRTVCERKSGFGLNSLIQIHFYLSFVSD